LSTRSKTGGNVPKTQPTLIRVGSKGALVNVNNCVSIGIVRGQTHNKLRDDWKPTEEQKEPQGKDYVAFSADTLSFYFTGRDELILRVGMEITQEEFENTALTLQEIVYEARDARVTTPDKAA
jgi:hypothetical protein